MIVQQSSRLTVTRWGGYGLDAASFNRCQCIHGQRPWPTNVISVPAVASAAGRFDHDTSIS